MKQRNVEIQERRQCTEIRSSINVTANQPNAEKK